MQSTIAKQIGKFIGGKVVEKYEESRMVNLVKDYLVKTVDSDGAQTKRQDALEQAKEEVTSSYKMQLKESPKRVIRVEEIKNN